MRLFQFRIRQLSCVVALLALIAAGCGGGDDSSAPAASQDSPPPSGGTNAPPTIQGQPGSSVVVGQAYSFQPSATDPEGDPLTFSASNLPVWATLNSTTGRISGTPTSADIATYSGITISVSDGTATQALEPFSIAVLAAANGMATLSWVPPTQNSDGTTLTNLAGYQILFGQDSSQLDQSISLTNPSLSSYVVENLASGTWYFAVVAVNSAGTTSPFSNVASKTIT
jgi:hypothetical protein